MANGNGIIKWNPMQIVTGVLVALVIWLGTAVYRHDLFHVQVESHLEDMDVWRIGVNNFMNAGDRFTNSDGDKLEERIKKLEQCVIDLERGRECER